MRTSGIRTSRDRTSGGPPVNTKGQLILKCPFGVFKSSKKTMKFFPGFLP